MTQYLLSDDELRMEIIRTTSTRMSLEDVDTVMKLIKQRDEQVAREAKLLILDELIDIESKTFNQWTQKDIAHFFDVVGKKYRALEHLTITHKGDE